MSDENQEPEPQERIEELEDQLRRVHADYQNFRRRTQQQQEQARKKASEQLIKDVLTVMDNLELALSQAEEETGLYQGVELVLGQLISTLEDHGVQKIHTETFDPHLHEAILSTHSEKPEGSILEVMQHGYQLNGVALRTAKVKVSKGPQQGEQDNE